MGSRGKSVVFGLLVVCVLGFGLHQFLSALTARRVPASVQKVRTQLREILPETGEPRAPEVGHAVATADHDATAARWKALFALVRAQYWERQSRWNAAMRLPLEVRWGGKKYNDLSENDLALLTGFVQDIDEILREIRGLSQPGMPTCYFYSRNDPGRYSDCELYLSADLLLATNTGDHARAVEDIIALTKMCDAYAYVDYPFRMHDGTQQCLRDAIASGAVDDSLWDSLLQQLARSRERSIFADAWARVVQQRLEWYEHLPEGAHGHTLRGRMSRQLLLYGYTYAAAPLRNRDVVRFSDVMAKLLPLATKPFYEVQPELDRIRDRHDIQPPWDLHGWTDPGWREVSTLVHERFGDQAGVESEIDLARMAILLERHRRESGNYPETLDAIAAGLGGEIPLNPFLGEPYHYQRVGDSFRLWYEDSGPAKNGGPDVRRAWIWPGEHEFPAPA